jgi:hypothetical protein
MGASGYTIEQIRSVSGSHFTGALAPGVTEHENLSFPDGWGTANIHKMRIHQVIMTIDNTNTTALVPFYINLFGTSSGAAGIDAENWQGRIEFAEADFEQIASAGLYRGMKDLTQNPLYYVDIDHSGQLHVTLENTDGATTWHADDEVQITFIVEPIL